MALLDEHLLLGDTSSLLRFFAVGPTCSQKLAQRLGERLLLVNDVAVEIERWRTDERYRAGADAFFSEWQGRVLELPTEVVLEVNDELKFHIKHGLINDDRGETASVLFARNARQSGVDYVILMGDRGGHEFAKSRDVPSVETKDLLFALTDDGALSPDEGELVWLEIHARWAAEDPEGCRAAYRAEL